MPDRNIRLLASITVLLIGLPIGGASVATAAAQSEATPAPGFAHPEWFADPEWLAERLGDEDLAVVALTPAEDFAAGHIPKAAQIDWPALEIVETDEASVETWQGEVEAILTDLGIDRTDTVVVYDGGTFWAARLWWILHFLGHADVRVLDGGLQAWTAAGGELETGESIVSPATEPYQGEPSPDVIATIDEAVADFEGGEVVFVDARSAGEYGEGHIPSAVNVPFTDNAVEGEAKSWKSPEELLAMYAAAGVTPDQRVIPYCTTGVRSAVTYFTLRQLGFEQVALFTGSFEEWSADPERPVETGS
jgi:thiosulfate/3-mercaptopyruvate sulfurtransferase